MKLTKKSFYLYLVLFLFHPSASYAQQVSSWQLEKMPVDLESDFALSALPPHIRDKATVYLLDPLKGYYISRQGTNGFICFVLRTEWQRADFKNDIATPISYDAEGARTIFPVFEDVASMRASGKYSAAQVRDSIAGRFRSGYYKAPAKPGLSYMLAPIMRNYDGPSSNIITMSIPHYMFYAPYITAEDIGGNSNSGPMVIDNDRSPHEYIIVPVGEMEKAMIVESHKELLKRLVEYRSYFKVDVKEGGAPSHHH